ncbi:MAG: DUF4271 domain-containing protein [Bacteroidales bacterium]|nr:MAG: DUF4271 domain-containing protein [Bacteroidales bacterium]
MVSQVDSLLRVRLDTLPAAELRRLAEPWCGRTEASDLTSAADTLTPPQGLYATAQERVGAFTQEGLRAIAERWRHAREIFRDVDAATMFGDESSLSYGAQRDTVTLLSDTLSAADGPVQPASDMITHAADSLPVAGDSLSIAGDSLSLTGDSVFVAGDSLFWRGRYCISGCRYALCGGGGGGRRACRGCSSGGDRRQCGHIGRDGGGCGAEPAGGGGRLSLLFFCLYRYFDDVRALFGSVFRRSVAPSERMLERRRSEIFYGFLGKLFLIGTCTLGAIASLWADRTVAWEAVGPYARVALPFAAMAAFVAVVAVQYAMLAVAGGITRSWSMMAVLLRIRLIYFVLATVIVLPPVLMWQMNGGTGGEVWLRVACLAAAVAVVMYVRESVTLFNSKKISILHWILYLCIVEIMPFTLLWQIVVRMG